MFELTLANRDRVGDVAGVAGVGATRAWEDRGRLDTEDNHAEH